MTPNSNILKPFLTTYTRLVDQYLDNIFAGTASAGKLLEAMRYSLLNGGKRIRPLLLLATIDATGGDPKSGLPAAAAVEMIHAYSLIHDDLPAMDDDDLRRGKPTCHIIFGEANAILAGDALQTMAFEILANTESYTPAQRLQLIRLLAKASGTAGMVAGQAIDLSVVGKEVDLDFLRSMHRLKTGALLEASILMGAACNQTKDNNVLTALRQYAQATGLAFQIRDDIMDVEGDTVTLGKTQGKDAASNKPTYTSLLGLSGAKAKAEELHTAAIAALTRVSLQNSILSEFATMIIVRNS